MREEKSQLIIHPTHVLILALILTLILGLTLILNSSENEDGERGTKTEE